MNSLVDAAAAARATRPTNRRDLWLWINRFLGIHVPTARICKDHSPPFDILADQFFNRPSMSLVHGPRGAGKAQPLTSLVQTPRGPVRMGDLVIGSEVCTPDGGVATVLEIHEQGIVPTFRVTFTSGDAVECCESHLWEVSNRGCAWPSPKIVTTRYLANPNLAIRVSEPLKVPPHPIKFVIPKSVDLIGPRDCRCITISSPDGLYMTDHCVVTHNSFTSAIDTHLESRFYENNRTVILGGSLAQSRQIYDAIAKVTRDAKAPLGNDADTLLSLMKQEASYRNGSLVSILAASSTSVHGPHAPNLKLDEVDEIDPGIREEAMGMNMGMNGRSASVMMTSTWHRVGGPMATLMDRGRAGEFSVHSFCMFEVLERCEEKRSGKHLENCPQCPLVEWCHADRDQHPSGLPKAKRSFGHYPIDSLIQKTRATSRRVFESDYLCVAPSAQGAWYKQFNDRQHVDVTAEYNPSVPYHVSVDPGVCTGAVMFQVRQDQNGDYHVNVYADYYGEDTQGGAEKNAMNIRESSEERTGCSISYSRFSMDPNCGQRTAIGPTVRGEFEKVGCSGHNGKIETWPSGPGHQKTDGLMLIEALLEAADGSVFLKIHPRCRHLINAFKNYKRASKDGQWLDFPEDPQHPAEDLIDALAGGLKLELPYGRRPKNRYNTVHALDLFH